MSKKIVLKKPVLGRAGYKERQAKLKEQYKYIFNIVNADLPDEKQLENMPIKSLKELINDILTIDVEVHLISKIRQEKLRTSEIKRDILNLRNEIKSLETEKEKDYEQRIKIIQKELNKYEQFNSETLIKLIKRLNKYLKKLNNAKDNLSVEKQDKKNKEKIKDLEEKIDELEKKINETELGISDNSLLSIDEYKYLRNLIDTKYFFMKGLLKEELSKEEKKKIKAQKQELFKFEEKKEKKEEKKEEKEKKEKPVSQKRKRTRTNKIDKLIDLYTRTGDEEYKEQLLEAMIKKEEVKDKVEFDIDEKYNRLILKDDYPTLREEFKRLKGKPIITGWTFYYTSIDEMKSLEEKLLNIDSNFKIQNVREVEEKEEQKKKEKIIHGYLILNEYNKKYYDQLYKLGGIVRISGWKFPFEDEESKDKPIYKFGRRKHKPFAFGSTYSKEELENELLSLISNFNKTLKELKQLRKETQWITEKRRFYFRKKGEEQLSEQEIEEFYKHKLSPDEEKILKRNEDLEEKIFKAKRKREERLQELEDLGGKEEIKKREKSKELKDIAEQQLEGEKELEEEQVEGEEELKDIEELKRREKEAREEEELGEEEALKRKEEREKEGEYVEEMNLEVESALMAETQIDKVESKRDTYYKIPLRLFELTKQLKELGGVYNYKEGNWVFTTKKFVEEKKSKGKKPYEKEGKFEENKKIKEQLQKLLQNYYKQQLLRDRSKAKKIVKTVRELKRLPSGPVEYHKFKIKGLEESNIFDIRTLINTVQENVKERSQHELIGKKLRNPLYRLYNRRLQRKLKSKNPLLHISEREEKQEIKDIQYTQKYLQVGELVPKDYVETEKGIQPISSPEILGSLLFGVDDIIDTSVKLILSTYMNNILENNVYLIKLLEKKGINADQVSEYLKTLTRKLLKDLTSSNKPMTIYELIQNITTVFVFLDTTGKFEGPRYTVISNPIGTRAITFRNRLINDSYTNVSYLNDFEMFPEVFSNPYISDRDKRYIQKYIYMYINEETQNLLTVVYYDLYGKKIQRPIRNIMLDLIPSKLIEMPLTNEEIFKNFEFCNDGVNDYNLFSDVPYTEDNNPIIYYDPITKISYCFTIDELLELQPPYINIYNNQPIDEKFMIDFKLKYKKFNLEELKQKVKTAHVVVKEEKEKEEKSRKERLKAKEEGKEHKQKPEHKKDIKKICRTCKKLLNDEDSLRSILLSHDDKDLYHEIIYFCARTNCLEKSKIPDQFRRRKKKNYN